MEFIFDIRKTVAAVGVLCELGGGKIEVREMLKMLYLAEREAITQWYRSITGDQIFSMPQGMVLSRVYNLCRYNLSGSEMDLWKSIFTPKHGHTIHFQKKATLNKGPLSDREEKALKNGFKKIRVLMEKYGDNYIDVLHKMLPEWRNPNGSLILVEPDEILSLVGEEKEDIELISADIAAINSAKLALQSK